MSDEKNKKDEEEIYKFDSSHVNIPFFPIYPVATNDSIYNASIVREWSPGEHPPSSLNLIDVLEHERISSIDDIRSLMTGRINSTIELRRLELRFFFYQEIEPGIDAPGLQECATLFKMYNEFSFSKPSYIRSFQIKQPILNMSNILADRLSDHQKQSESMYTENMIMRWFEKIKYPEFSELPHHTLYNHMCVLVDGLKKIQPSSFKDYSNFLSFGVFHEFDAIIFPPGGNYNRISMKKGIAELSWVGRGKDLYHRFILNKGLRISISLHASGFISRDLVNG